MKDLKQIKPLIKLMSKKDIKNLIIASIILFLSGIAEIFTGFLNGLAVEKITKGEIKEALLALLIYFTIEITFDGILKTIASSMLRKVESSLTRKLGFKAYKKALNLPALAYEEKSSGEIINRITNDADTLSFSFEKLLKMVSSLIATLIIIIYIYINSYVIGTEIVIFVGLLFIVIKKYNPKLKDIHSQRKSYQDKFTSLVTESIRGIREIKTLGIKNNLIKETLNIIKQIFNKSKNEIDIQKEFDIITKFIKSILEVGVFISCIFLLYYNKITLTFFIAMTYYIYRYTWLIDDVNDLTKVYQKTIVSLKRVNEILINTLYEDEKFGVKSLKNIKGIIKFDNVNFAYPNEEKVLDNFSLTILPNKKIAIVGKSGQGKSTIFNLLTRIFDVSDGSITIDGVDIRKLSEKSLRNNISIIRQEPFIFNRTIKDNFKIVNKNITLKEIRKYCKEAYIDDYIMSLPKKYNTILGEGGVNLSGGQKQRLSIARTLSKKSKIILFDEATSALDNESQEYVKKAIDNLVKNHTVIIVAHRLSIIKDADVIHIIDKGKIVTSSTHSKLLKTNEIYKNLYKKESLNS